MRYTPSTCAKGKAAAKLWLQGRLGLPQDSGVPVVAFVGRLTEQKGVDVLLKALYASAGPDVLAANSLARSLPSQVRLPPFTSSSSAWLVVLPVSPLTSVNRISELQVLQGDLRVHV